MTLLVKIFEIYRWAAIGVGINTDLGVAKNLSRKNGFLKKPYWMGCTIPSIWKADRDTSARALTERAPTRQVQLEFVCARSDTPSSTFVHKNRCARRDTNFVHVATHPSTLPCTEILGGSWHNRVLCCAQLFCLVRHTILYKYYCASLHNVIVLHW